MTEGILLALGGVGLFLLGMHALTDGLKGVAGSSLRRALTRFTRSPLSGMATGAVTTAIVQSSSATTVATVGFVSAGLITFPQALGIIFGANIGTTFTGWVVAVLGFKLQLGQVALPLVFAGALTHMLAHGRMQQAGWALAGFSLLFIGIDMLQAGMLTFEGMVTPESFPGDTLGGRLLLVLIGIAITVVTQSSSAGLATALAAIGAGAISLPQAAAMVIGMNIGTTFTAVLASIGGSAGTRRTGLAHVTFNVMTGVIAFLLLTPYFELVGRVGPALAAADSQILLVTFHTGFNILGVLLFLPFSHRFARLVERLVPDRGPRLTRHLDDSLLADPAAAVDALAAALTDIAREAFVLLARNLDADPDGRHERTRLAALGDAIETARLYAERVKTPQAAPPVTQRYVAAMHVLDHVTRLQHRLANRRSIDTLRRDRRLRRLEGVTLRVLERAMRDGDPAAEVDHFDRLRRMMRRQRETFRGNTIRNAADGRLDTEEAMARLDAVRWLHRVSYHLWRLSHHLGIAAQPPSPPTPPAPTPTAV